MQHTLSQNHIRMSMLNEIEAKQIHSFWFEYALLHENIGQLFYDNLLKGNPELRILFKADIGDQSSKFTATMTLLITKLYSKSVSEQDLIPLARRHSDYGTKKHHYSAVGEALIKTLKEIGKENWNSQLERAFVNLYSIVSEIMIRNASH